MNVNWATVGDVQLLKGRGVIVEYSTLVDELYWPIL